MQTCCGLDHFHKAKSFPDEQLIGEFAAEFIKTFENPCSHRMHQTLHSSVKLCSKKITKNNK